ncbi:hypothetical protein C8R44DRAFT_705332 [Mycena epipterygia]|nr:hypothetical protein C8R44DRAFT_705332 [Mycena epipterygia]
MSCRGILSLSDLLNPEELVDAQPEITALEKKIISLPEGPVLVSSNVRRHLRFALDAWGSPPPHPNTVLHAPLPPLPLQKVVEHNVKITRKTTVSTLYRYPQGTSVEYPETASDQPVGHLFYVNPDEWVLPWTDFAYSRGAPDGGSKIGSFAYCSLLVDQTGSMVPCKIRHATCQGIKACEMADHEALRAAEHTSATRQAIEQRLADERQARLDYSSPQRDVFLKTAAYIAAVKRLGCQRPPDKLTARTPEEQSIYEASQAVAKHFQRGYLSPATCDGRIIFQELPDQNPYLRSYDLDYLAAVFTHDTDEIEIIEQAAELKDYGPLATCASVANYSTQRSNCPLYHRENGELVQKPMCHVDCEVKYRIWYPVQEERQNCPYALVTSFGIHTHPIPLPEKTPGAVRAQILAMLEDLHEDLPDMTPRRFMRHPTTKSFLRKHFPDIPLPTLSHLHPSLANRAHLGAYIARAKKEHFPEGTDWKGVLRLKRLQDEHLPDEEHYIRAIIELDNETLAVHEEDDPLSPGEKKTRIIICMTREASRRLKNAAYLRSDIGFKRIVGFDEFEMAAMDRDANTSVIFCRVYLNRHTAEAHRQIFQEIERIVRADTHSDLRWRHLHGRSLDDFEGMILHWGADQHRGQAKGLGLHLVSLAALLPDDRMDLHEPERSLQSLSPYDHLRRLFRLCIVHNYRNIKTSPVPEPVRNLMRSLSCIQHSDWDKTIDKITADGGKAGHDWVRDKETSKFAFGGMCWEKSFIPLEIWKAGEPHSNLIETVHRDVNREGVHCTLLGGLLRGQYFDANKMQTLRVRQLCLF